MSLFGKYDSHADSRPYNIESLQKTNHFVSAFTPGRAPPPVHARTQTIEDALRDCVGIPVKAFALVVRMENGKDKVYSSASLKEFGKSIFMDKFWQNVRHTMFRHAIGAENHYLESNMGEPGTKAGQDATREALATKVNRLDRRAAKGQSIVLSIPESKTLQRSQQILLPHQNQEGSNFIPLTYNPANPPAPEAICYREKTPPPEDGWINLLKLAARRDRGQSFATFIGQQASPGPSQPQSSHSLSSAASGPSLNSLYNPQTQQGPRSVPQSQPIPSSQEGSPDVKALPIIKKIAESDPHKGTSEEERIQLARAKSKSLEQFLKRSPPIGKPKSSPYSDVPPPLMPRQYVNITYSEPDANTRIETVLAPKRFQENSSVKHTVVTGDTLPDNKNDWESESTFEANDIPSKSPDITWPRKKHYLRESKNLSRNQKTNIQGQRKQIKSKDKRIRSKELLIRQQKRVIKQQERLLAKQKAYSIRQQRNLKFWLNAIVAFVELQTIFCVSDILQSTWAQLAAQCNALMGPVISHLSPRWKGRLPDDMKRLTWICSCGHTSYDEFIELEVGATVSLANQLMEAGYISRAQVTNSTDTPVSSFIVYLNNGLNGIRQRISNIWSPSLPTFTTINRTANAPISCMPTNQCRWLHMCLKKRPYATKLEPLHVCKDEEQNTHTDATFFKALRKAYYKSRSWQEKLLFKLSKIEFVEFDLCPEELIDHITPDKLPPDIVEYDFMPPPPLKKCPPIGPSHMMHLFTSCTAQPLNTSLYLRHIPKRKENALSFRPDLVDGQTGYGLHFVERLNSALVVTVMFSVSLVVGIVFAIWWSVKKEDVQGAFGVASYVTSVLLWLL